MEAEGLAAAPAGMEARATVHEAPDPVSRSSCVWLDESVYSPAAAHAVAVAQDTEEIEGAGSAAASAGRGIGVAVHKVPSHVSINPCRPLAESV
jgi:hypothetical protein